MKKKEKIINRQQDNKSLSKEQFARDYFEIGHRTLLKWMRKNKEFLIAYQKAGFYIDRCKTYSPKQQELILFYFG